MRQPRLGLMEGAEGVVTHDPLRSAAVAVEWPMWELIPPFVRLNVCAVVLQDVLWRYVGRTNTMADRDGG